MADLEILHNKLPKVKEVEQNDFGKEQYGLDRHQTSNTVQSFPLRLRSKDNGNIVLVDFQPVFAKWLYYKGPKYQHDRNSKYLNDNADTVYEPNKSIAENCLTVALSNMKDIINYAVEVLPLTKRILETLDMNDINSKKDNSQVE